ncbi:helix-turn-helix transcriptional regulator [Amycolatopsis sp. NPDC051371]|uniref:helix-turn-helix transcriptional regulator n=1 Tax=Amycolatopsis sp. NPDC051371 TaxID=3155800 RepID=UPI003437E1A8
MTGTLSEKDLHALYAAAEDGLRDDPGPSMPWATMDALQGLVPCDAVGLTETDVPHRIMRAEQWVDDGERTFSFGADGPLAKSFFALREEFRPCVYPEKTGDLTSVITWSDFYSLAELRRTPFFCEIEYRCRHCMAAALPAPPGVVRRILLYRDRGRDFTERDRLVLRLLRPHLYEVYLDAERRRGEVPRLSPREYEVLRLAAQGRGNADIAAELFVSVSTVRKHMEHIFDRTGVRTRAAAAALVLPHLDALGPR